ncbi:Metal dependent hydrolase [Tsukamurella ocularis]
MTQFKRAGLQYRELAGIFLTHLHADHVADYYNFFLMAGTTGERNGDVTPTGLPVYGPGSAGELPAALGGRKVPTVAPTNPVPGTRVMTEKLHEAFAYTSNIFLRDAGFRDPRDLPDVREIGIPEDVGARWDNTAPDMRPFTVMEDDRVKVTATLVPHGPVFPAFAFRFDTDHGSVTFSGDTRRSENLIRMAKGSDILVHEALRIPQDAGLTSDVVDHHRKSHVFVDEVGPIAQSAEVPSLVLSHIEETGGRTIDASVWTKEAQRGYDGTVTVGTDLMAIGNTGR